MADELKPKNQPRGRGGNQMPVVDVPKNEEIPEEEETAPKEAEASTSPNAEVGSTKPKNEEALAALPEEETTVKKRKKRKGRGKGQVPVEGAPQEKEIAEEDRGLETPAEQVALKSPKEAETSTSSNAEVAPTKSKNEEVSSTLPEEETVVKKRNKRRGRGKGQVPVEGAPQEVEIAKKVATPTEKAASTLPKNGEAASTPPKEKIIVNKRGTSGTVIRVSTNYFDLKANQEWLLYKHHVEFNPVEERTYMKKAFFSEHLKRFGGDGTGILFDGSTAFSRRPLCSEEKPLELTSIRRSDETLVKITVQRAGILTPGDSQTFQICNLIIRKSLKALGLTEIRRKFFDVDKRIHLTQYKVELLPGYLASISQREHALLMNTEVSYKVLRKETALDLFRELYKKDIKSCPEEFRKRIIGCVVMTTYNERQYTITDVDYKSNALSTFKNSDGSNITFKDYFLKRYGERGRITDDNQFLLVSKSTSKQMRAGAQETICLVPELCVQTGISEEMRKNHSFMEAIAEKTANNPLARISSILQFSKRLSDSQEAQKSFKEWGLSFTPELIELNARVLPQQEIVVGRDQKFLCNKNYEWSADLRNKPMYEVVHCTNWVLVFTNALRQDANSLTIELGFVAQNMGMQISKSNEFPLQNDRDTSYVNGIEIAVNQFNPQIVVALLSYQKTTVYNAIKKQCIIHKPVPSQVVVANKCVRSKNFRSIATKIAIQMNAKLGGVPWLLNIPLQNTMIVGFDVCHDPSDRMKSFGAVVATTNKEFSKFFVRVRHHKEGQEITKTMGKDIRQAAENNAQKTGQLPGKIFIYRDGVGKGQESYVRNDEIQNIKADLRELYGDQPPKITFVIVNKRISTRFFHKNENPPPGTVVDDVVTLNGENDFFIISQSVRHGTVNPTHYKIILDEVKIGPDKMQLLTYRLTHFYYNWSGTVRVPNVVQYAHKAALLNSQAIGKEHTTDLSNSLYFL